MQYRVPVWQEMQRLAPGSVHVVYATDCSVRGHHDDGFGQCVAWDEPLLSGYDNTVLNCEHGKPLSGWASLSGRGVRGAFRGLRPTAVLLTGLNYKYDLHALGESVRRRIPVWLRCETQDDALPRAWMKSAVRSGLYRGIYNAISRAFYIGELNRRHYRRHGVGGHRLRPARYCTVDRFRCIDATAKQRIRQQARHDRAIGNDDYVVGFCGKLIPKKNPDLLFEMASSLPEELRRRTVLYFVGSGELENDLQSAAKETLSKLQVRSHFEGFVNQSELGQHYLAMDSLVLPSRRMGETWGLVANEALQAGCSVAVSDAVGCGGDFGSWERFRIFQQQDARDLARSVGELAAFPRDFDWARTQLSDYRIEATAEALLAELQTRSGAAR